MPHDGLLLIVAIGAVAGAVASMAAASVNADGEAAPIFVTKIPSGYRDWRLISVANEEGSVDDIRAVLGNDTAIKFVTQLDSEDAEGSADTMTAQPKNSELLERSTQ